MRPCHKDSPDPSCKLCALYETNEAYRLHADSMIPVEKQAVINLWRSDRCISLQLREESKPGCRTGLGCRHSCKEGMPAVPNGFCQTCYKYKAHPRSNQLNPVPWVGDWEDYALLSDTVVEPTPSIASRVFVEGAVVPAGLSSERPIRGRDEGLRPVDLSYEQKANGAEQPNQPDSKDFSHGTVSEVISYSYLTKENLVKPKIPELSWQYCVTTVPSRRGKEFDRTLASLKAAGFDRPHLFVDGDDDSKSWVMQYDLPVTCRYPALKTAGNWVSALYEMWQRDSTAERYAVFQDDFVTYPGLREYLDWSKYPEKGYLNLYTCPKYNQHLAPKNQHGGTVDGWFMANQLGKGAVALVFDRAAVQCLLGTDYLCKRFLSVDFYPNTQQRRCDRSIDGGIVECLKRNGFTEWCHSPSLVQHIGLESSMGNSSGWMQANSFKGEGFDARSLIS